MISYTEKIGCDELRTLPPSSVSVRIESMNKAYGGSFDFLDFWIQKNETEITAALCRFSGELWILANENADFEELSAFCKVSAPTVLTDVATAKRLGVTITSEFIELCLEPCQRAEGQAVGIESLYKALIKGSDGDVFIPDYAEWYADISHRMRHGTAAATLLDVSVALAGFVGENAALITGASTDPDHRGKGEGKAAVMQLAAALYPRKIFAEATENTVKFYEKCGFARSRALCRARS